jgi:exodeoxyribonuclease V alpha subunit
MSDFSQDEQQGGGLSLAPYFVEFLKRVDPDAHPLVFKAADLAVRASEAGNVCLFLQEKDLVDSVGESPMSQQNNEKNDPIMSWKQSGKLSTAWENLLAGRIVGRPGEMKPLILDKAHRLYLYRYWKYENSLAERLLDRARENSICEDFKKIGALAAVLFPEEENAAPDWQKIAAVVALLKRFCVICGGPGTGKTSTVVKIMALLLRMAGVDQRKFGLAAPTGKAAVRLQDSIKKAKRHLNLPDDVVDGIPDQVQTIHRLLGYRRYSPYFRHNEKNLLDLDVLIVDEASMVDLALMAKLFAALPERCRVILLGDKEQLASVEAGRVLGDICRKDANAFSDTFAARLAELGVLKGNGITIRQQSSLDDSIVILEKSYRFGAESGIGNLAKAINSGDFVEVSRLLSDRQFSDIQHNSLEEPGRDFQELIQAAYDEYGDFFQCTEPQESFDHFEKFRILCVHRKGRYGARMINSLIEEMLIKKKIIPGDAVWYAGRPVLITKNDYSLGLFNGDTGVVLRDGEELRVFFPGSQGAIRSFSPYRLPDHETAFAVTVHKSQGSEFDHVGLLLPKETSPVLCRELLYTAVTRASKRFTLWGEMDVLKEGVEKTIQRSSGLAEKLAGAI